MVVKTNNTSIKVNAIVTLYARGPHQDISDLVNQISYLEVARAYSQYKGNDLVGQWILLQGHCYQ